MKADHIKESLVITHTEICKGRVFSGNNFVECSGCGFHAHQGSADSYIQHDSLFSFTKTIKTAEDIAETVGGKCHDYLGVGVPCPLCGCVDAPFKIHTSDGQEVRIYPAKGYIPNTLKKACARVSILDHRDLSVIELFLTQNEAAKLITGLRLTL